jgi:asparagine synthase (glutamine-hydrolysing)
MRDVMSHRGPDGAGLWRSANGAAVLAHRRLAVVELSAEGAQPMASADGRWVISYNGELYNDAEVRGELAARGVRLRTRSDTETVLAAIAAWGIEAFAKLRGMYGVVAYDTLARKALMARDPLGIKPLYWWTDGGDGATFVVASEAQAILAYPELSARPDLVTISSYLTTIRTTLGSRTLFEGVRTLRPGEVVEIDLWSAAARVVSRWRSRPVESRAGDAAARMGAAVRESVGAHLRSDVPVCSLLSGGIDSTVIAMCAARAGLAAKEPVRTYCSGFDDGAADADLACARRAAAELGTVHTEAPVMERLFLDRWAQMVERMGMPLSTPNEVAINEVARRLRADGRIVALSGEGADELLAGYDVIMNAAMQFEAGASTGDEAGLALHRAMLHIEAGAWVPTGSKQEVLSEGVWRACEHDAAMREELASEFAELAEGAGPEATGLDVHLRYLRRVNLAGLLQRLDTSTMLESVEGRTPFADVRFAEIAESMPTACKFVPSVEGRSAGTKLPLRAAFAGQIPDWVVARPKASFPLPFAGWLGGMGNTLRGSKFASAVFAPGAVEAVAQQPAALWRLAWPMLNLAMWGDRWWGSARNEPRIEVKAGAAVGAV